MRVTGDLQPTLWRTCRVLANDTRLDILGFLFSHPDSTVSAVAQHLDLSLSVASEYLRMLESRSLLEARRVGRWVKYRVNRTCGKPNFHLIAALRETFQRDAKPRETIFSLVTAFTH